MAPAYSATKAYQINYMEALRKKAFKNGGHIYWCAIGLNGTENSIVEVI